MITILKLLIAILHGSLAYTAPPAGTSPPVAVPPADSWLASTELSRAEASPYRVYFPLVVGHAPSCQPIPGVTYGTLDVDDPPTDPPAEQHPDINLALRGYELTTAYLGLVAYGGNADPAAPQLYTLFADQRVPAFTGAYQVYDWDWASNRRGGLIAYPEVTLVGMGVTPGEVLHLPDSGYNIGSDYEALVLYAAEERITLKYTREDNVVRGYTVHIENICVEPSLLALYVAWNNAGRGELPALRGGQPFGRARTDSIGVAIRDTGTFLDPRSRHDWWQSK